MHIQRHSIWATAVVLGIVSLLLPGSLALYWSWHHAYAEERAGLAVLALTAANHGHHLIEQVHGALEDLKPPSGRRCAAADIARMRVRTIDTRYIEEIGYQRDGQLLCNSWGKVNLPMPLSGSFTEVSPRMQLRTASFSLASPRTRLISLSTHGYYAYVEPGRFANIALPEHVGLVVFLASGELISGRQHPDWAQARKVLDGAAHDPHQLTVVHTDHVFRIVASQPMQQVSSHAERNRWTALPLALLCSVGAMILIATWLRRRLSLAGELRSALDRGELQVYYQPIIELASGRCIGAEALARWQHRSGRWIPADLFIAEAERRGMIGRITIMVMQTVLNDMGPLLRSQPELHISINLSPRDITDDHARSTLSVLLEQHGVAASQIWLEMTERGFMDADAARTTIARLREIGHRVSIDDFGTGYSSLSYLQTLPLDVLKIDKSFVDMIATDAACSGVIDHIIGMAKSLGLMIVAEGIETALQADYLRQHQVEFGQGWLFAKAMPAARFMAFHETGDGR